MPTVPQAAELLLSLLGAAQTVPVQLRLLALEGVSPTTTAKTLPDLTTRLAAFERPGRRDIIRDVYTRFTQLPAWEPEPAVKARPQARRTPPAGPAWWRSRTLQTAAASVALLVAAGLAAAWLWQIVVPLLTSRDGRETPGASAAAAGDSMSAAAVERFARRPAGFGLGRAPSAPLRRHRRRSTPGQPSWGLLQGSRWGPLRSRSQRRRCRTLRKGRARPLRTGWSSQPLTPELSRLRSCARTCRPVRGPASAQRTSRRLSFSFRQPVR